MFTLEQLKFIQESLTQKGAAIPCHDDGKGARVFVSVLDEIAAQRKALETPEPPAA